MCCQDYAKLSGCGCYTSWLGLTFGCFSHRALAARYCHVDQRDARRTAVFLVNLYCIVAQRLP